MADQLSSPNSYPFLDNLDIDHLMSESEFNYLFPSPESEVKDDTEDRKESSLMPTAKVTPVEERHLVSATASTHATPGTTNLAAVSRFIAVARAALTDLEKEIALGNRTHPVTQHAESQAIGCQKRKRCKASTSKSAGSSAKRVKRGQKVSVRALKVCWKKGVEAYEYVWSRGGFWVTESKDQHGEFSKLEGEVLVAHGPDLTIEVRPNGEWLPIWVRMNEATDVFEGWESIDNRRLEIECAVMFEMLVDPESPQKQTGTIKV